MLCVETIGKIRRAHFRDGRSIKGISRDFRLSRETVRKVLRSGATEFVYERRTQPRPKIGPWESELDEILDGNASLPERERATLMGIFEDLRASGYKGGYDAVRRHAARWRKERRLESASDAFVPLVFDPGEAYQFDWSHEDAVIGGKLVRLKVAHVRLCHSRMSYVRAYHRESQEMLFDAHEKAFAFFGGACGRGIYDNMRTAVDAVFAGKDRAWNARFLAMCSHHLVEPVACTRAAGWEKGQVENQVRFIRNRLFKPRRRFESLAELNAWLEDQCLVLGERRHPDQRDMTVLEVFEAERASLVPQAGPFEGHRSVPAAASKTCLVQFDNNRYSVEASAAGGPVEVRAYAERIEIRHEGRKAGEHARAFGRGKTVYDPLHYLPALRRKPGALRNGAPFKGWDLPEALSEVRRRLEGRRGGDRKMVDILLAIRTDGIDAVEAACADALSQGVHSSSVILNILARRREPPRPEPVAAPDALRLACEPAADCSRYDSLRRRAHDPIATA